MPATRPRRIVRRAVMALAVVALLLVCITMRAPPEIERSRSIRFGMTRPEVEAVMGTPDLWWGIDHPTTGMYFGRSHAMMMRICDWIGVQHIGSVNDWPVKVRFDNEGRVDGISRGDKTEWLHQR